MDNRNALLTATRQTESSHRTRGIHDVREAITWECRPVLIVHDSGGFEAGADDESQAIDTLLKEKSAAENLLAQIRYSP
jgi:hypothetical protein